jgi:hypothetical protein
MKGDFRFGTDHPATPVEGPVAAPRILPRPLLRGTSVVRVGSRAFGVPSTARRTWMTNSSGKVIAALVLVGKQELHILLEAGQIDRRQYAAISDLIIHKYFPGP